MSFRASSLALCLLGLPCVPLWGAGGAPSVQVTGAVSYPGAWSVARIGQDLKGDLRTVHYTLKGQTHTARCVPLVALIEAARPRENPRIKHHMLQFVVVAQGRDGYAAAFSLAEMLPQFGHEAVWVALDQDGTPLPADSGSMELLVPGDRKPARWVHGLAVLTVVDEAQMDGR